MPYVNTAIRNQLEEDVDVLVDNIREILEGSDSHFDGILNYTFTKIILDVLGNDINYNRLNSVVGVLESCKLEFYRRQVSNYEDSKIKSNGDVYGNSSE